MLLLLILVNLWIRLEDQFFFMSWRLQRHASNLPLWALDIGLLITKIGCRSLRILLLLILVNLWLRLENRFFFISWRLLRHASNLPLWALEISLLITKIAWRKLRMLMLLIHVNVCIWLLKNRLFFISWRRLRHACILPLCSLSIDLLITWIGPHLKLK